MINHSMGKPNKDRLIKEFLETMNGIQVRFQSEDDEERQWLIQNSPNLVVAKLMKEMTVLMLHVLDAIGKLEPVNGITISKKFGISKASVSRITRKLVDKQIILIEYLPDNKKEFLFRTTSVGKEIYHLHQALHHHIDSGAIRFLQKYNENELQILVNAHREILQHSWVHSETIREDTYTAVRSLTVNEDRNEIMMMLNKLDSRSLKKAKAILNDVFFSVYED